MVQMVLTEQLARKDPLELTVLTVLMVHKDRSWPNRKYRSTGTSRS